MINDAGSMASSLLWKVLPTNESLSLCADMQAGVGLIEMPNSTDLEFSDECME